MLFDPLPIDRPPRPEAGLHPGLKTCAGSMCRMASARILPS